MKGLDEFRVYFDIERCHAGHDLTCMCLPLPQVTKSTCQYFRFGCHDAVKHAIDNRRGIPVDFVMSVLIG